MQIKHDDLVYIDDYAHHPNEISAAISSTRERYPDFRYTAIFQPHLYTRTRDFAPEFAAALSKVDRLVLLDIYPAREEPIPGVTSEIIFNEAKSPSKVLLEKEELLGWIKEQKLEGKELFMTLGAGDIDRLVGPIAEILTEKHNGR
jgi:UDP-N-acetylmuramate--alanine ligase